MKWRITRTGKKALRWTSKAKPHSTSSTPRQDGRKRYLLLTAQRLVAMISLKGNPVDSENDF